ncbi:MAG: TolC family protein, partial [Bacteroidia bacterium]|nr:TolC family protein [Bacteroidia bacterium]
RRDQNPEFGYFAGAQRQDWFQITKEFNVFGQRTRRIELAERQISVAQAEIQSVENDAMFAAGALWLDALDLHWQIGLLERALQNIDSVVQTNEARLRNSVITPIDMERTRISRRDFANRLAVARADLENTLGALRVLTGAEADFRFPDETPPLPVPVNESNIDSLTDFAFQTHPVFKTAEARRQAAVADLALQRALAKPIPEAGFIFNPQNAVPYAGIFFNTPIPIFDRNQGNVAGAQARLRQAESEIEAQIRILNGELARLAAAMRLKRQNWDLARQLVAQNEKVIAAIKYSYLKGGTTLIDYLGAQDVWFDSIEKYNRARIAYLRDYLDFAYRCGILATLE